jgi:rhamnopyranosyl-N-acetylglucosaminyl-diphospho-decaprenol beta-1,3/1,4-galactofuranosyltransferase
VKILAAVVTYNRRELLSRCIDQIEAQTRAPDGILIVNNASADGTAEMLAERGVQFVTQPNLGSAGGWRRAIEFARDGGFDAVWLMDDDGRPDIGALTKLEAALIPGVLCASSVVVCEDDPERFVFPVPLLNRNGLPALLRWPRKLRRRSELAAHAPNGIYPFVHLFNGALISMAAVIRVGNVEPGYFMFGDEVDYFCRLRKQGAVVSVIDAVHYHPDVSGRPYTPAKVYYYVKNSLILHRRYFDKSGVRNALALVAVLARVAQRNGIGHALSYVAGREAPHFYGAIRRGLAGQVGKDFDG